MKCPYRPIITHQPYEEIDGYPKHYAQDITEFGECYKDACPFYCTSWAHKKIEHCRKAESETT